MAPFNMRCSTCGEYIYKGKKFNARKEDVEGQDYLKIKIFRFYIKCTRCLQEISFKTDPQNTDYEIEAGATRNFMALKLAEEQAKREADEEKEEEATNPMKLLEKRTQQSKNELDLLESLEELKDLNRRQQTIDYDKMLEKYDTTAERLRTEKEQEELDELEVQQIFKNKRKLVGKVVEEETVEIDESEPFEPVPKVKRTTPPPTKPSSSTSLATKKKGFGIIVRPANKTSSSTSSSGGTVVIKPQSVDVNKSNNVNSSSIQSASNKSSNDKPSGLSLLGAYSDSEEDNSE